jgi:L-serine/L-threonine ammonia-lyase
MMYGYPATVVVPSSAKPAMLEKLRAAGATAVIQYGSNIAESQAYIECVLLPQDPGGVFVPPFDHPDIWEGNATVMREIAEDLGGAPDVVACSVGGGGLLNGICKSLDERGWGEKVEVVATETAGADSLSQALLAGEVVTLPRITSAATSLGCVKVSQKTFEYAQRLNVSNLVLDDAEAMKGCCLLFEHEGLLTELTVGVNVPLCFDGLLQQVLGHRKILTSSSKVVIIVCGGSDISLEMLADWRGALIGPEIVRGIAMDGIVQAEVQQIAASG